MDGRGVFFPGLRRGELAAVPGFTWLRGNFHANNEMPFQQCFPG